MVDRDRVLVIGGCGYIGSRLYDFLTQKKYKVDTVDLEWFGNYVNPKNYKKNYKSLTKEFLRKYNVVILLAGYSSIPMSEKSMVKTFNNNVVNFIRLLNSIDKQIFIYASSASVYGNTKDYEATEEYDKYSPTNYYDLSKKEIDYYAHLSKISYYGLRMGTVCGFSPNLRTDVMINKIYETAASDHEIVIFNKNFYRPILGIEDFCRVISAVIQKKPTPGLYNVASFNTTIEEIAARVAKRIGNVNVKNIGKNDSYYNFSVSTEKFRNNLRFEFKETIDTIIDSLIKNSDKAHKGIRV